MLEQTLKERLRNAIDSLKLDHLFIHDFFDIIAAGDESLLDKKTRYFARGSAGLSPPGMQSYAGGIYFVKSTYRTLLELAEKEEYTSFDKQDQCRYFPAT